jgi:riboflavin kinase/FMN adenylyltransferase
VVTIGVFDGVHLGHQRVVAQAARRARDLGHPLVAVVLDPPPGEVTRPGTRTVRLTSPAYRTTLLAGLGADYVYALPFTYDLSMLTPEEFARRIVVGELRAAAVVTGAGFRFGHDAAGDAALLAKLGEELGFTAEAVETVTDDGAAVSAARIRGLLAAGDVQGAARELGRPHRVEGIVVRGHQRGGSALGFPTANVETPPYTAIPSDGVYAGRLRVGGETWPAAISVGVNTTFGDADRSVEAYALDRDDLDLYGTRAAVDFVARLRDMVRFDGVESLVAQMHQDVGRARAILRQD